jgi:hypothetical protein
MPAILVLPGVTGDAMTAQASIFQSSDDPEELCVSNTA